MNIFFAILAFFGILGGFWMVYQIITAPTLEEEFWTPKKTGRRYDKPL